MSAVVGPPRTRRGKRIYRRNSDGIRFLFCVSRRKFRRVRVHMPADLYAYPGGENVGIRK